MSLSNILRDNNYDLFCDSLSTDTINSNIINSNTINNTNIGNFGELRVPYDKLNDNIGQFICPKLMMAQPIPQPIPKNDINQYIKWTGADIFRNDNSKYIFSTTTMTDDTITLPTPGVYHICGKATFAINASSFREIYFQDNRNGTLEDQYAIAIDAIAGEPCTVPFNTYMSYDIPNIKIRIRVYQDDGASIDLNPNTGANNSYKSFLNIVRVL